MELPKYGDAVIVHFKDGRKMPGFAWTNCHLIEDDIFVVSIALLEPGTGRVKTFDYRYHENPRDIKSIVRVEHIGPDRWHKLIEDYRAILLIERFRKECLLANPSGFGD